MLENEKKNLQIELEQYQKEKEQIRNLIGKIGGTDTTLLDKVFNYSFIIIIAILFTIDFFRHIFHVKVPLPDSFSIQIGLLLVSIKIIWMIHKQTKVEHFQFWILNSIEFRLNDISKKIQNLEKKLK